MRRLSAPERRYQLRGSGVRVAVFVGALMECMYLCHESVNNGLVGLGRVGDGVVLLGVVALALGTIGKNKIAGANQLATGSQSGDLPTLETELHNHKEHTAAQIGELQTTLNVYQESLNAFRTEMMAEFRALKESTMAPVKPVSSTPLRLGSALPEGGATILGALQESAGSTHAMASSGTSL
ncbi:hypothetical protein ACLB2K_022627 [Fragaria x ananassa]